MFKFALGVAGLLLVAAPASAAVYTNTEAATHVGEQATVQGRVTGVHLSTRGTLFLNFGLPFPSSNFVAMVPATDAAKFGDPNQYKNKTVQVSGKIQMYQEKPEIVMHGADQLKVMPADSN